MNKKKCAAQHFGPWMIDAKWFTQAVAAVKAGTFKAGDTTDAADTANPNGYAVSNGVAVVPIHGQITKGTSSFGGTSSVEARRAIRNAVADDAVESILLHIDSPGGTVAGTGDLAADVAAANKLKPVYAHIDDLGASAAYWIASQTRRVTANATAEVGSIGLVAVVEDTSGAMDKAGVKVYVVSTGPYKGAFADGAPITPEQLAQLQTEIDDLNEHFLAAVMSGRQMSREQLNSIADGRLFIADKAQRLGLIDAVQSLDQTIKEIRQMTLEAFKTFASEHPEATAAFVEQGKKAGVADGRAEAKAEFAALLAAAKNDYKLAAEAFAAGKDAETIAAVIADREARAVETAAKDAEIAKLKAQIGTQSAVSTGATPASEGQQADKFAGLDADERIEAEWNDNAGGCKEKFKILNAYRGYRVSQMAKASAAKTN